jgi:hypothetical protein
MLSDACSIATSMRYNTPVPVTAAARKEIVKVQEQYRQQSQEIEILQQL